MNKEITSSSEYFNRTLVKLNPYIFGLGVVNTKDQLTDGGKAFIRFDYPGGKSDVFADTIVHVAEATVPDRLSVGLVGVSIGTGGKLARYWGKSVSGGPISQSV